MTKTMLVTGATGTLGRDLMTVLRGRGHDVRGLSRSKAGHLRGDLLTGAGIRAAVDGAEVIIHAATDGRHDVRAAANLLDAVVPGQFLLYVSIVGVDRVPLPYYRQKLEIEGMVRRRGGEVLRATQFHDLILAMARALTRSPVAPFPALDFQPVGTLDVARRLAEIAEAGAVDERDFGGPEVRSARDLFESYLRASGKRRLLAPVRLPGRIFRGYRSGGHLTPGHPGGEETWAEFLRRRVADAA